jgi:hypothetical protein
MALLHQIKNKCLRKLLCPTFGIKSITKLNERNITFTPQHEELRKTVQKVFQFSQFLLFIKKFNF